MNAQTAARAALPPNTISAPGKVTGVMKNKSVIVVCPPFDARPLATLHSRTCRRPGQLVCAFIHFKFVTACFLGLRGIEDTALVRRTRCRNLYSTLGKGLQPAGAPGHNGHLMMRGQTWWIFTAKSSHGSVGGGKAYCYCKRKGATMVELATGWVLRHPEVAVALVGGKTPEQVEANTRYVNDLTEKDLAEIKDILEAAPYES